jgi:serine/threonine protein phosphatase PrpC
VPACKANPSESGEPMPFHITHGVLSDVGRKRAHNEDRYCTDTTLGLFAVCDGMGGSNAGEVASALAIETIHRHINEASQCPDLPLIGPAPAHIAPPTNRLASAIRTANRLIYDQAARKPEWVGMGTTVVAALLTNHLLSFAHVGDSRLYLVRAHTIHPLTTDHSWVAEQVRSGLMTEEEAERSPRRNMVTRALGVEPDVDVSIGETELHPGDILLLCSDGLTKGVGARAILHALTQTEDMSGTSRRLVTLANDAGGEDNTTVINLAIHDVTEQTMWHRVRQHLAI